MTFTWKQIAIFKISLFSISVVIGAYWSNFFISYSVLFLTLGIVLGLYLVSVWIKQ